jgi:transposase-like protein
MPNQFSPKPSIDERELRGQSIAQNFGWVRRVDDTTYMVHSQRLDREYQVEQTETGWVCDCPDSSFRLLKCKHIWAVEISWTLRKRVEQSLVIQPVSVSGCLYCQSSRLKRSGVRQNLSGGIQRFACLDCGRTFSINLGFEKMRASPQVITSALQLYFSGESLRNVQKFLRLQGVNISHVSVSAWITKYVGLMGGYLEQMKPQLGDTWRTDEMYVKVKGNPKWLFAMMDDETRFWIAQQVCEKKWYSDVRPMFRDAEAKAGKRPKVLISDGAHNFETASRKEWGSLRKDRNVIHVRDIRFGGEVHNNKMERLNGEIRDREKTMRGLKRRDTPILKGLQLFHNYIRPHEGLGGKTPSEMAGIKVEGENKWLTIIQNASQQPTLNSDKKEAGKPIS